MNLKVCIVRFFVTGYFLMLDVSLANEVVKLKFCAIILKLGFLVSLYLKKYCKREEIQDILSLF